MLSVLWNLSTVVLILFSLPYELPLNSKQLQLIFPHRSFSPHRRCSSSLGRRSRWRCRRRRSRLKSAGVSWIEVQQNLTILHSSTSCVVHYLPSTLLKARIKKPNVQNPLIHKKFVKLNDLNIHSQKNREILLFAVLWIWITWWWCMKLKLVPFAQLLGMSNFLDRHLW